MDTQLVVEGWGELGTALGCWLLKPVCWRRWFRGQILAHGTVVVCAARGFMGAGEKWSFVAEGGDLGYAVLVWPHW